MLQYEIKVFRMNMSYIDHKWGALPDLIFLLHVTVINICFKSVQGKIINAKLDIWLYYYENQNKTP